MDVEIDLGFGLEDCVVVITGAGGQIGRVIAATFLKAGCKVAALDRDKTKFNIRHERLLWLEVDTTDEQQVLDSWKKVEDHFSAIPSVCVCAAALDLSFVPRHASITTMPVEQFRNTLDINVTGTFITAKAWLSRVSAMGKEGLPTQASDQRGLQNVSLILIGSEAGFLGVSGNPDYAASKSAVQTGLMLSLAADAARIHQHARVNAVCPGAVDTAQFQSECDEDPTGMLKWRESEATVPLRVPVSREHVARACLMLASDKWSGSITAQAVRIDSGKSGRIFWDPPQPKA